MITKMCEGEGVSEEELRNGGQRRRVRDHTFIWMGLLFVV
jgi:hypothetical protein